MWPITKILLNICLLILGIGFLGFVAMLIMMFISNQNSFAG